MAVQAKRLDSGTGAVNIQAFFLLVVLTAEAGVGRTFIEAWRNFHSLLPVTAVCVAIASRVLGGRIEDALLVSSAVSAVSPSHRESF